MRFVPSLREYARAQINASAGCAPASCVMHPGPMNRGVEIDRRVDRLAAALIVDQVAAGLVVRMAVLYDLLTAAPG